MTNDAAHAVAIGLGGIRSYHSFFGLSPFVIPSLSKSGDIQLNYDA
jgi:hypothetical protein